MKNFFLILTASSGLMLASCNNAKTADGSADSTDSKKVATDSNKMKADSSSSSSDIKDDAKFAVAAADGGMLEVELGKLALSKSTSPQIKALAQMMVDDHSKANEEFKKLAASKNISIPATLSTDKQQAVTDLAKKTGADFDKAYASSMVDDHKEDIGDFKKEASDGKDADIKSWAAGKLPVLEHHLQMSQNTEAMLKNKKGSSNSDSAKSKM